MPVTAKTAAEQKASLMGIEGADMGRQIDRGLGFSQWRNDPWR